MGAENNKPRYLYIDNLRLVMIILVVLIHFGVTYSGIGGWYIKDVKELDTISYVVFGLFQSFTQAYFMGFLFLISGYFVAGSYEKKGAGKFISERLVRLGIPTLIYMLVVNPFINYVLLGFTWDRPIFAQYYLKYIISFDFLGSSGPLWFAFALLIFNLIYAMIRLQTKDKVPKGAEELPGTGKMVLLGFIIALVAFLIRLVQPIDTSILNMQLCFFSQYIILYIVGIKAGRYDWFSKISYRTGRRWLLAALLPGTLIWVILMLAGGALSGGFDLYKGGFHWQSAGYALWESFTAVAMSIGLIGVFREKYNRQSKLTKLLSDNSFAVYMFHAPVIIGVSIALLPIEMYPLAKFLLATAIGLPLSFLLSNYIFRKIPYLKRIL
ncbi:acyltransferase family protein [Lachnospiraceae bacterium MD1]|uniref:Acyltransferase family protein n=1 Tax=Variimorphobacter saccharofermentans TaxID=2755051 RepID=A0A839JYB9_9FIRM|nr:acyltransferase family protein [Variimorphobacter saccharofermentans]MBB2182207.1 acyltransferase family protein [Variimorphobacter saccharofermentans]